MARCVIVGRLCGLVGAVAAQSTRPDNRGAEGEAKVELGNFSVSLAVKDLAASRAFYEKLGLRVVFGSPAQRFLILQNETATIGLFQGMFEKNILTFNPGWDSNAKKLASFADVREIERHVKAQGVQLAKETGDTKTGPASFIAVDPDGNQILFDQHVSAQ